MSWYRQLATLLLALAALLAPAWLPTPAGAQGGGAPARLALVIGNAGYKDAALASAVTDARAAAEILRQGDFDVIAVENADAAGLERALSSFKDKLTRGAQVVVFYAGHAVQLRGRNFLVPVDAAIRSPGDLSRAAIDFDRLLDALIVSRPASAVIVLDAARDNPWQAALGGNLKGLAPIEPIENIAVMAPAAPGRTIAEPAGRSSPAVEEWLKAIRTPGLDMAAALTRSRDALARRKLQIWISSLPAAGLVVTPTARPAVAAQATRGVITAPPPPGPQSDQLGPYELSFWETIRNSENPAEYRAYLDAYPNGRFASLARTREEFFRSRGQGRPAPSSPPQTASVAPGRTSAAPGPARIIRDCDDCPELALIPAGGFEMGSNEMFEFEKPVRTVTIGNPFYIGTREVTFAEWDACVAQGGCSHRPGDRNLGRGNRPVTDIHWNDAGAYVVWLSLKTGRKYRLPTEAEWEYAARAGTATSYPWGNAIDKEKANCVGCNAQPRRQAIEVGQFPPNAFGLYDMAGNAAEWVADCWSESYRASPRDGSAYSPPGCRERVLRGGSFNNDPRYLRSAARFKYESDVRFYTNGFRVVREP
ncbi:SUMF1/EgtB/PvdO family nonheme iron enzyme [Bosea sp. WAO]|uniref:SUMF1/EgtB/PvdO family nonheme iron enzyme n=1 Tax=Bosea sp. WAO TaxID=406341 RepID=UPI00082F38F3|nr:SUMF1/EgtB/PvdO family nonheme iron enzyme [Bosea sp. WAO]